MEIEGVGRSYSRVGVGNQNVMEAKPNPIQSNPRSGPIMFEGGSGPIIFKGGSGEPAFLPNKT